MLEIADRPEAVHTDCRCIAEGVQTLVERSLVYETYRRIDSMAFTFNKDAKYPAGVQTQRPRSHVRAATFVRPSVDVSVSSGSFQAQYPDPFQQYVLPKISSDLLVNAWHSSPMGWWQNQLNFAVWCATTGCGVSEQDHLQALDPMIRSLYGFHVYYQIRRILTELRVPLPQDKAWSYHSNAYDKRAYERLCNEFGVGTGEDWRVKGHSGGLGKVYIYITRMGYHVLGDGEYNPRSQSFTKTTTNTVMHVDYIQQENAAWNTFILDKSEGLTRPGVERLNDSIRTYVWSILGSQAQTRTRILGTGTAFDAQKQFLVVVEDAIASPVDLPTAIERYQKVLQYAGTAVDFSFGTGLYMAPSDMLLRIGQVSGYNNEIVIATSAQTLGINTTLNKVAVPAVPPSSTGFETNFVNPKQATNVQERPVVPPTAVPISASISRNDAHDEEKTALIIGGVAISALIVWLATRGRR